jgi:signal peptidase I
MNTQLRRRWRLVGALLLLGLVYLAPLRLGIVLGESMSPSMRNGSFYLLDRTARHSDNLQKGDVVVFAHNGTTYVKRVLALPGDTVYVFTLPGSGRDEFVMDWELEKMQRLASQRKRWYALKVVERRVPDGHFYAVGDHLSNSVDSREFGPVPVEALVGKVVDPPDPQPALNHVATAERLSVEQVNL